MYRMSKNRKPAVVAAIAVAAVLLSACGSSNAGGTPTVSVEAIYTAAIQTFQAQQATELALTPPTDTPTASPFPTLPPVSPIPTLAFTVPTSSGIGSACDGAAYVADVTIPDGTVMAPGQSFTKKWKLQNTGSCTWSSSYEIAFASGNQMGGTPGLVKVPVPSGNQTEMAVQLTAPTAAGSYTGTWRMQNAGGQPFGSFVTVVITVGSGGTVTPGPSPTPGGGNVIISGDAGANGVTLTFTGTTSGSVNTGDGRSYAISVPSGWTGTITPSKGNTGKWTFDPTSKSFTAAVTANQTINFRAISVAETPTLTPTP